MDLSEGIRKNAEHYVELLTGRHPLLEALDHHAACLKVWDSGAWDNEVARAHQKKRLKVVKR
jgi:hypothetical protein